MAKKVLLLGALGYIGSRLRQVLSEKYSVTAVDISWFSHDETIIAKDYERLTADELNEHDVVIVLAGHSSVKSCDGNLKSPWLNNVTNFSQLLDKLDDDKLVIYASSASVYGNSDKGKKHREHELKFFPVNNYDVTKYALDQQAQLSNLRDKRVIGLRFGTVNGWSPRIRCDVMINAMYHTVARLQQNIQVTNSHISRAILGIEDLCRAMIYCIEKPSLGIYNLSSFNATVAEIADTVARKLRCKVLDRGNTGGAYDFRLDTTRFEQTYEFKFQDSIDSIVDGLVDRFDESEIHFRDNYMIYNREKKGGLLKRS